MTINRLMTKKFIETEEERHERLRNYDRKYLSKPGNKEKRYLANQKTQSARYKRWQQNNKDKVKLKSATERAMRLQRVPAWSNKDAIKDFYLNCPEGHHVDHIIPLRGKEVSGLHVLENLQYLPAKENLSKGNKFEHTS